MSRVYLVALMMAGMCLMATAYDEEFYRRKLLSFFIGTDMNGNGIVEEEDYQLTADKLIEHYNFDEEKADLIHNVLIPKLWSTVKYDRLQEGKPTSFEDLFLTMTELRETVSLVASLEDASEQLFEMIDVNQDEALDVDEFGALLKARIFPDDDVQLAFDATDQNEDGKIGHKEYMDGLVNSFISVDPNDQSKNFWGPLIDKNPK